MTAIRPEEEKATCRGCGCELIGKPYYMGGSAYLPGPNMVAAKVNHFGGYVCSYQCDRRVSVEMHASMPGCRGAKSPDPGAAARIRRNWPEEYR